MVVVFSTHSDVEATLVRGLLEANGVRSFISAQTGQIVPLAAGGYGEVCIAVEDNHAADARKIIEDHRSQVQGGRVVRLGEEFAALERAIDYRFRDAGLLEHALTHTSRANEDVSGGVADNESLEFLGDAVLGFVVADALFRDFPAFNEGQKSKVKASLVSTTTLAKLAEQLGLGDHLLLGRGEEKTGGRQKQALLADAYEALIAAIYLDGGIEKARRFVLRELGPLIADVRRLGTAGGDYKSALQELLQAGDRPLPEYRVTGSAGPDHRRQFQVDVIVQGQNLASGTGPSKKDAEQDAARRALEVL
ncbi:MAG: ribonuclease III, partial [Vicinamibacterales bacterium]